MATTEELEKEILAEMAADPVAYSAGPVDDVITIDGETRVISVPASEILFGVETDKDVERKHFRCPKIVGDDIDLSKHQIYISYITSDSTGKSFSGDSNLYLCEDVAVDGDDITFSWRLSGNVFANAGFIAFKVLAAKTDGENVQTRWNTVPAVGTVLMTVPDGMDISETYPDIVTQLLERMESVEKIATEEAMQGYVNTYLEAHPAEIDETLTDPKKAAPADVVGGLKEDIVYKRNARLIPVQFETVLGYYSINSLASTGGKVFLTKGKFFISAPINTADTLVELCGEGALLDLHEDTLNSDIRGGTILQAVGNTDLVHIGGAKGTTVHDIAFFGYGRNKVDNTSYGIKFTGYADTDRIYNCGFTNCAIAIGSDTATDVVYIHNLSVQRNKIGIALYRTDAEIHDCIFCENIGMESVIWNNETYDINCSDVCTNDGKIYNNTFRRSGMCYDIYKVYENESGLESDDVKPISSVVVRQRAYITGNKFYDCIYANCIRVIMKPDFLLIEGNSFTKWGHKDQADDRRKSAICFDKGSVLGTIMNNRFYSDSNTDKFTDKYAIYEVSIGNDDSYWSYSNTYANNFIGNLTGETDNKCVIVGTSANNKFINNIIAEKYKDTAIVS